VLTQPKCPCAGRAGGAPPDPHTQDRLLARECGEELQAMLAATLDKLPALRWVGLGIYWHRGRKLPEVGRSAQYDAGAPFNCDMLARTWQGGIDGRTRSGPWGSSRH